MKAFEDKKLATQALSDLRDFLQSKQLYKKQEEWAKKIGKSATILSRNFRQDVSLGEAKTIFLSTMGVYGIDYKEDATGKMIFTKMDTPKQDVQEKSIDNSVNVSRRKLELFTGVYIGQFLEFEEKKFSDIILVIEQAGSVLLKTHKHSDGYEGNIEYFDNAKSLVITCKSPNGLYHVQFVLKSEFNKPTDGRKPFLYGVYSAFSVATLYKPVAGVIKFDLQPNGTAQQNLKSQFDALTPQTIDLKKDDRLDTLITKRPDDVLFFLGQVRRDDNDFWDDVEDILFGSVTFFKSIKLIPSFDFHARRLPGTYLLFRLSTDRQVLFARPIIIHPDGRVKLRMKREEGNGVQTYHGRAHILESGNGCLAISIDRLTTPGHRDYKHRTHYLFKINAFENREEISHLFGKSLIINLNGSIRTGDEVLVKTDVEFSKLEQLVINVKDSEAIKKLLPHYQEILSFLQKGVISTVTKDPNDRNFETTEDFGFIYFSAACLAAEKVAKENTDDRIVLDYLDKAFRHGFEDKELLKEKLLEEGDLYEFAEFVDVKNMRLR
jgi:hypothetical protein